ncbi:MAG: hypothetical protein QM779_05235 [Propionicimonas sp.]|uniref:hypothetical protein n=1 Tax=Propionicimonas sp. TaxID=1955623 RepID=UPI003D0A09B6
MSICTPRSGSHHALLTQGIVAAVAGSVLAVSLGFPVTTQGFCDVFPFWPGCPR